jgi:hypothetical protein
MELVAVQEPLRPAGSDRRCQEMVKPSELRPDDHRNPRQGDLFHLFQEGVAGHCVDLDALSRVKELARLSKMLAGHLHVERHGVRIGVDLDDAHLGTALVDVKCEVDETGFVRPDRWSK